MGGNTTSTVDSNNPYTNQLAQNANIAYGLSQPFLNASLTGQQTPWTSFNNNTADMLAKKYSGQYHTQFNELGDSTNLQKIQEQSTMPDMSAINMAGSMYGAGQPSAGGTTQTSQQNLGPLQYAQLAATVASLFGA